MKIEVSSIQRIQTKITLRTQINFTDQNGKTRTIRKALTKTFDEIEMAEADKFIIVDRLSEDLCAQSIKWVDLKKNNDFK